MRACSCGVSAVPYRVERGEGQGYLVLVHHLPAERADLLIDLGQPAFGQADAFVTVRELRDGRGFAPGGGRLFE